MRKWLVASLAATALAGAGVAQLAFAAPGDPPPPPPAAPGELAPPPPPPGGPGVGPGVEFEHVLLDARIGGVKFALKLTPEQEKLWPPFETAVRDIAKTREDALKAWRERDPKGARPTPIDRLTELADRLGAEATELKQLAEAAKPLFASLDDKQKRDFGPLLHSLHEGHHGGPEPHHDD